MSHMEDGGVDTTDTESGQQEMGQMADFTLLLASSASDLYKYDVSLIQSQTLRQAIINLANTTYSWTHLLKISIFSVAFVLKNRMIYSKQTSKYIGVSDSYFCI